MKTITLPSGHEVFLDDEDYGRVGRRWHIHQRTDGKLIAVRVLWLPDGTRPKLYLQRVITPPPTGMDVDFRNEDGLDCRKKNLYFRPKEEMKARPDQYRKWNPVPAKEYNILRNNAPRDGANEPLATPLRLFSEAPAVGILFPKPGECLVCETCGSRIADKDVAEMGKNHDAEAYWCNSCTDYQEVRVEPDPASPLTTRLHQFASSSQGPRKPPFECSF